MTPERLREIYGDPIQIAVKKVLFSFDDHCRDFIANAPFLILSTSDGQTLDASPKGDQPGFVAIESETTLLLPDRPGNNRIDGLMNILRHPQVAMLFMIPTVDETLRVNGTAEILDDPDLCSRFAIGDKVPKTVLRIRAEEIYIHCGRSLIKSGLWKTDGWPRSRPIEPISSILKSQVNGP